MPIKGTLSSLNIFKHVFYQRMEVEPMGKAFFYVKGCRDENKATNPQPLTLSPMCITNNTKKGFPFLLQSQKREREMCS